MNSLQFYYVKKVLGLSSIIQTQDRRLTYRLHNSLGKKINFLFFCNNLPNKNKELIQKMAQAIGVFDYAIVEILEEKNPRLPLIFKNLLTRFPAKGGVIFGQKLACKMLDDKSCNAYEGSKYTISLSSHQEQKIPLCVFDDISKFMGPNLSKIKERKKQAWTGLKLAFVSSS